MAKFIEVHMKRHSVPELKEVCKTGNRWVMMGNDDKYPNYLLDLYNRSSVNKTLVNGKASYIYGKSGISSENLTTTGFIDKCNSDHESLNDVLKKCAIDEELFGGYYLKVVWNLLGSKILGVSHMPFQWMRSNESNTKFFYSDKFSGLKKVSFNDPSVVEYPEFNANVKNGAQVLFVKNYTPDVKTYCLPDYSGANPAIETNIEINDFHLNNIKNGFSGGYLINFKNGQPTPEDKKKIYKDLEQQHTGAEAAGRFVLVFSEGPSDAPDIVPLTPNDLDKVFEQLRKDTNEEIFIGHRAVSPILFGIKTEGQLGGVTELLTSFQIFQSTVINEKQEAFSKVFSNIVRLNTGVPEELKLTPVPPVKDVVSVKDVLQDLTADERRGLAGFDPLANTGQTEEKSLGEKIGVGGVQSIQSVLADITISADSKVQFLIVVFSLPEIDAMRIVYGSGQTQQGFSRHRKDKQKDIADFEVFNKFGRSVSDDELLAFTERSLDLIDDVPVLYHFDKLTDLTKLAISIIRDQPNITVDLLGDALKIEGRELTDLLKGLERDSIAWVNKSGGVKITKKGETITENLDLPELDVVYKYEKSPFADGPAILPGGRTRDFCELMVRAKKVYTREEIDRISERLGYNVWKFRGGWTTTPAGEHVPYCRHIWKQYVVKKK